MKMLFGTQHPRQAAENEVADAPAPVSTWALMQGPCKIPSRLQQHAAKGPHKCRLACSHSSMRSRMVQD